MSEEAWVKFGKHFKLLESNVHYMEEHRLKRIYKYVTGDYFEDWLPFEFEHFMSGLAMVGPNRSAPSYSENPDEMKNRNTFDELVAWVTERESKKVLTIEFDHVEKFSNQGGSEGTQTFEFSTTVGKSTTHVISHTVMASIEYSLAWSQALSPIETETKYKGQYDFSSVSTYAQSEETTESETLKVDLSKPLYLYQKQVTVRYADGTSDIIFCGTAITSEP